MNTNHFALNFFVDGASNVSRNSLFLIALKFAQKNHKVLFVARQPLERLPIDNENPSANILRNIIFRYAKTVNELRQVILELHSWALAPRLLIIDSLHEFIGETSIVNEFCADTTSADFTEFCEAHCIITAATQNAVDSMSLRLRGTCASIISIDFGAVVAFHRYYERFRLKYFDLYYFDAANRYHAGEDNLNALRQKLLNMLINQ